MLSFAHYQRKKLLPKNFLLEVFVLEKEEKRFLYFFSACGPKFFRHVYKTGNFVCLKPYKIFSFQIYNNNLYFDIHFILVLFAVRPKNYAGITNIESTCAGRRGTWPKSISSYVLCNKIVKRRIYIH